jgi:hypothetical protein
MAKEIKKSVSLTLPESTIKVVENTISESDGLLTNFSAGVNYLVLKGQKLLDKEKIKLNQTDNKG